MPNDGIPAPVPLHPKLVDLDVLHAPDPAMADGWARHDVHELVYLVRGRYRVEIDGAVHEAGPGTAFCYPPGKPHRAVFRGPGCSQAILLQWHQDAEGGYPLHGEDPGGRLFAALSWMLDLHRRDGADSRAALGHLLAAFLHEWRCGDGRDRFLLESVRTYVGDHLGERLRVEHLAAAVGLSKFHLMRRFHRLAGQPLMAWVLRQRLERARRLLADPDLTLAAIASQVGLSSAFHLSHRFKQAFGVPPRTWRRQLAEGARRS